MLPLFFIDVPARGHQSRPFFSAFFGFDKWIPPSSCFRASNLRFSSDREHGGLWKCSVLLFSLFLICGRRRKDLCHDRKWKQRKGSSSLHSYQSRVDIHILYKQQNVFTSKIVQRFCKISDFRDLMFQFAYISLLSWETEGTMIVRDARAF